jgi:mono/diheme cytochrome c family protein
MGKPIIAPVLGVDAAVSPDNRWIAIAHAGTPDPSNAKFVKAPSMIALGSVTIIDGDENDDDDAADAGSDAGVTGDGGPHDLPKPCQHPPFVLPVPGQATAVAFNPVMGGESDTHGTWFVVQTREPAQLVFYRDPMGNVPQTVALGGPSAYNTGHELFHRDVGTGIACASCHLEGAEDGRVWKFSPIGERRTQALDIGIAGTAPFHWDGDMTDFNTLMNEVFVHRMGGVPQGQGRTDALLAWVSHRTPPKAIRATNDPAVSHGRDLFMSSAVGCATCHSGAKFTNNQSAFVGTTEGAHALQVPSLIGVGYRAPFLHDGCAKTLRDRFDPACGGSQHGNTSQLGPSDLDALVAFLDSL